MFGAGFSQFLFVCPSWGGNLGEVLALSLLWWEVSCYFNPLFGFLWKLVVATPRTGLQKVLTQPVSQYLRHRFLAAFLDFASVNNNFRVLQTQLLPPVPALECVCRILVWV